MKWWHMLIMFSCHLSLFFQAPERNCSAYLTAEKVKIDAMIESKAFKVSKLLNFRGTFKLNSTEPLW